MPLLFQTSLIGCWFKILHLNIIGYYIFFRVKYIISLFCSLILYLSDEKYSKIVKWLQLLNNCYLKQF